VSVLTGRVASRLRALVAAALVIGATVASTGCTASSPPTTGTPAAGHSAPPLAGPWAGEFRREYERADSAEVRKALADGSISDQEYAEMKTRYADCLAASGVKLTRYEADGSSIEFPSLSADAANQVSNRCTDESGEYPISYLYWETRKNPDNVNQVPLIVECFKRNGLVEKSYTVNDYYAGDFPFEGDEGKAEKGRICNTDPTGRLDG
jgi:hypothetical protein